MIETDIIEADVLIIGGGIAGCRAAVEACNRGVKVLLVIKGLLGKDCAATWLAGIGYQCWGIYPHDTLDVQAEDTIRCGWFLNNQENVHAFLAHVPDTVRDMIRWGSKFRVKDGNLWPIWQNSCSTKEGRSVTPAIVPRKHGYHMSLVFPRAVRKCRVSILEDTFVLDLLTNGNVVVGALGIDVRTGRFKALKAKATILATGGYQGLYKVSTANTNLTGDGQAVALRAGVDMMDFEFNQTLPTPLWPPILAGSHLSFRLLSLWGAQMYNAKGERFMAKWDPNIERSTRAVISRAIFHEIKEGRAGPHGGVYVSIAHQPKSYIKKVLQDIKTSRDGIALRESGIDLTKDGIETGYFVHYSQGGCSVNTKCETDKPGLYAIGEVASGGKDGADRMTSNALPLCAAMGRIGGREAAQRASITAMPEIDNYQVEELQRRALAPLVRKDGVRVYQAKAQLRDIVINRISYGRTEKELLEALREVTRQKKEFLPKLACPNRERQFNSEWINALEFRNLLLVVECLIRNALLRKESRGSHDRLDYPKPDSAWVKNIHLRLVNGELQQWTTPVEWTYWRPEPGSLGEPWHKSVQVNEYKGWRAEPLYKGL